MKNPFSDIPLAEASSFFLNLRQFPKVANMAPPQILPATAMGQNKVPMTAPSLTPTARGENAIKVARLKRAAAEMAALPSPSAQGATPLDPSAYLAVEQAGQDAQNANAVEFYKQKLEEAKTELAQLQEGQQAAQGQIQQLSEQMQQSQQAAEGERQNFQSMAAQATQQAAMAQDQALMAQRASAAMRMAYQQLRGSLLELAQNDPPAGTGGDPSTGAPSPMMGGEVPAPSGAEGAPPPPGAPPAAPPPAAPPPSAAPVEAKVAAMADTARALMGQARQLGGVVKDRAPMMAAGALLGGGASLASQHLGGRSEDLRQKLTQQQNGDGGFANALRTATTKARLALSEVEDAHPLASAGVGALLGAGAGFGSGPQMRASVGNIKNNLGQIRHLGKK